MSEDGNKVSQENDSTKFCTSCGEKLLEGQLFCSKCGKKVDEKTVISKKASINKKYIYIFAGIILVIIVGIFTSINIKEKKQQEARAKYIMTIKDFQEKSYAAGANLEDIADTIQTYWKENIYEKKHGSNIDAAIFAAMLDKGDEIEKSKKYDDELLKIYSKLKSVPEGSEDLNDILSTIEKFYNSYTDFHSFATEPSGSYVDYSASNNTKTDEFLSNYRALENSIKSNSELNKAKSTSEIMIEKISKAMKEYKIISDSIPNDIDPLDENLYEKVKKIIPDFYVDKHIDVSDIENNKEKFKNDEKVNNGLEYFTVTKTSYDNMIKYANSYKKSNSQDDLEKFKSEMFEFRGYVAMYGVQVESLDEDN